MAKIVNICRRVAVSAKSFSEKFIREPSVVDILRMGSEVPVSEHLCGYRNKLKAATIAS